MFWYKIIHNENFKNKKKKIIYFLNILDILIEKNNIKSNLFIRNKNLETNFIYNKEIQINIKIKTILKENYNLNINFLNFFKIIKSYPEDIIIFKIIKNKFLLIKSKNIKSKLLILKDQENKIIKSDFFIELEINLKQKYLYNLINSIYFFLKKKNYINNGVFLYINKNKILFLINDNYRFIINKKFLKNNFKFSKKLIIQNKIVLILKKILINKKNYIKIKINKNFIKFEINEVEITSKLTETEFPKIRFKILKNYDNNFIIEKNILKKSLKRSLIIKNNINFSIWKIYDNLLTIKSENSENNIIEKLKINYKKNNISKILINTDHILDFLKNIKFEKIQINFSNNLKYLIIKIPELKNFKYIISSLNF